MEGNIGSFTLNRNSSLVAAILEVLVCVHLRQLPAVGGATALRSGALATLRHRRYDRLSSDSQRVSLFTHSVCFTLSYLCQIIGDACALLARLRTLCAPAGWMAVLPSCLLLALGVVRESSRIEQSDTAGSAPVAASGVGMLGVIGIR